MRGRGPTHPNDRPKHLQMSPGKQAFSMKWLLCLNLSLLRDTVLGDTHRRVG